MGERKIDGNRSFSCQIGGVDKGNNTAGYPSHSLLEMNLQYTTNNKYLLNELLVPLPYGFS